MVKGKMIQKTVVMVVESRVVMFVTTSGVQVAEAGKRVCLVVAVSKSNATLIFCWDAMKGAFSEPRRLATGCSAKVSRGEEGRKRR